MNNYIIRFFMIKSLVNLLVLLIFPPVLINASTDDEELFGIYAGKIIGFYMYEESLENHGCYTLMNKKRKLPIDIYQHITKGINLNNRILIKFTRKNLNNLMDQKRAKGELQIINALEKHLSNGYDFKQSCTIIYNQLHSFFNLDNQIKILNKQKLIINKSK